MRRLAPSTMSDPVGPPVDVWGCDPLFAAHARVFARDVHSLVPVRDVKDAMLLGAHPVTRVELCGVVVRVDEYDERTAFAVDDGTDTVSCIAWASERGGLALPRCALGDVVTVRGRLSDYRDERQIVVAALRVERDPAAEVMFWLSALQLRRAVYQAPFPHPREAAGKRKGEGDYGPSGKVRRTTGRADDPVAAALGAWISAGVAAGRVSFRYEELRADPELQAAVRLAIPEEADRSSFAIARGLRRLVERGAVFVADAEADRYEAVSHVHNLGPALFRLIRDRTGCDLSVPGVSLDDAVAALAQTPLGNVTKEQIAQSLELLVRSSRIYETGPALYRAVSL